MDRIAIAADHRIALRDCRGDRHWGVGQRKNP